MTLAHPTFAEIYDAVQDKIDDTSYTQADVMKIANKGRLWIASQVLLPALQTDGTVTTVADTAYVALPTDYMRNLTQCYSTTNERWIKVWEDLRLFLRCFTKLDQTGYVIGVSIRGDYLHYQYVPDDDDYDLETLKLWYYKHPTPFTVVGDKPTELHAALAEDLVAEWCIKEIFDEIEDGLEGQKVNTIYHTGKFNQHFSALKKLYGPPLVDGRDSFSA